MYSFDEAIISFNSQNEPLAPCAVLRSPPGSGALVLLLHTYTFLIAFSCEFFRLLRDASFPEKGRNELNMIILLKKKAKTDFPSTYYTLYTEQLKIFFFLIPFFDDPI